MSGPDVATVAEMFSGLYTVHEPVPWNGLALTYRAERDNKPVVLALLPIDCEGSPRAAELFDVRAKAVKGLQHPRLVQVNDHGVRHGVPFLELEYFEGPTLENLLVLGAIERERALTISRRILKALDLLEAVGVQHLDLTPSNVIVAKNDDVRIAGTGIAPLLRSLRDHDKTGPTGKGSGPSPGRYLAPELLIGDPTDKRADVYSVGALLHRMLTGTPRGKGGEPPPEDLESIIERAMHEDPNVRYASASAMRTAIESAGARPTQPPRVLELIDSSTPPPMREYSTPPPTDVSVPQDIAEVSGDFLAPAAAEPEPTRSGSRAMLVAVIAIVVVSAGVLGAVLMLGGDEDGPDVAAADAPDDDTDVETSAPEREAPEEAGDPDEPTEAEPYMEPPPAEGEGVDLLAGDLPEPLASVDARVRAGESLSVRQLRPLQTWAVENRGDARPHLLIARAFLVKGWNSNAVERYLQAWQADRSARNDSRMLPDLLMLSINNESGPAAATAIVRIYGRSALPAVEAKLAEDPGWPAEQRLQRLRTRLRRQPRR